MWRILLSPEIEEFRKWARDNYVTGEPILHTWHPVTQTECIIMNMEKVTLEELRKKLLLNIMEGLIWHIMR